ncbi:hypothetical protein CYLTODRAFT_21797 [Cylindrobasidium torrendii FP15055 ss-10]|uniref:Uncharacterized protein n=1 Tax=Cylindrobasidium torrendii FP15055 ss-10 TaxID=1314674 RepID=A0A0D7B8K0_9AGAR|nr:hypothetical protein CYLTODRAFT_21797 [Cylindrobasidium torrendii FP15055 ss-10]
MARGNLQLPASPTSQTPNSGTPRSPVKLSAMQEGDCTTPKAEVPTLPTASPTRPTADGANRLSIIDLTHRQPSHKLLTPPLTPSSSILSSVSAETKATSFAYESDSRDHQDMGLAATRFILVCLVRSNLFVPLTFAAAREHSANCRRHFCQRDDYMYP